MPSGTTFFDVYARSTFGRFLAGLVVLAIASIGLVAGLSAETAVADSNLSLGASTDSSVLAGQSSSVTLTATNPTATNQYNLSFTYVLPPSVSYTAGSTSPSTLGDPKVITVVDNTDPLNPISHLVLVWSNIADLPAGDRVTLKFGTLADPTVYPVGSNFDGEASAYAQVDARLVPKFDSTGQVIAGSFTSSDQVTPNATQVSALRVSKAEPSPESELMRGVHDQTVQYSIAVEETGQAPSTGVVVVDYLPATLEYLDCGGVDNSSAVEYSGAAPLTATPAVSGCIEPVSVDTVLNPAAGYVGVFTVVTWNLGTLAAGSTITIEYRAGIPLRANTTAWPSTAPSASSLQQASNLDNNTGALTRQIDGGASATNTAVATGTYTGLLAPSTSSAVSATGSNTVKIMDLSIVETTSSSSFVAGGTATYDLWLRSSEYTSSSGMIVTATVPNGICPLVPAGTTVLDPGGNPTTMPTDCTATGTVQSATLTSVTVNADGTFTMLFVPDPTTLAENDDLHIVYTAFMRSNYDSTALNNPTASGDSFSNGSVVAGTSTVLAATAQTPITEPVTNDSGATQSSAPPTIQKKVLPRTAVANTAACDGRSSQYVDDTAPVPTFRLGDRMCFELTVNFSTTSETRNAQITDFVPVGTTYEGYVVGAASTVPASEVSDPGSTIPPTWSIGHLDGVGSDLFVNKGGVLVLYVSAIVTSTSQTTTVDITDNLMKYRQQSTAGTVYALRDQANYGVAPSPTVALAKGITAVNGTSTGATPVATDVVHEGDTVDFSLTPSNTGTSVIGNDFDEQDLTLWDALPSPVKCADVSLVSAPGTCTDSYGGLTGANAGQSAIVWNLPALIAAGSSGPAVTYRITMPAGLGVSSSFLNSASVVSFGSPNTGGPETTFYPTSSLDTADTLLWNTSAANASATLTLPAPTVAKAGASQIISTNNDADHAVPGETIDYDYSTTVIKGTTVFDGVLSDSLPPGLSIVGSTVITADLPGGSGYTSATMPTGYTLGADGTLTFLATYDNQSGSDQTFTVHLAGVLVSPSLTAPATLTNTATFTSKASLGGTPLTPITATKSIGVVAPTPTLTKTVSPTSASAGQTVTYTLTATNGSSSPIGYDSNIVDCLPVGLGFGSFVTPLPSGVTAAVGADGSNGCASGTTPLVWTIGDLVDNANLVMTFTATLDPNTAGLVSYSNTATLTTSTLGNGSDDPAVEKVLTAASSAAVTSAAGATTTKSVAKSALTIGETSTYTITVTIPADINFWDAAIIDTVPSGMTLGTATVTCQTSPGGDCLSSLPGGGAVLTPTSTKLGWLLGDVTAFSSTRIVTVTYTGTVDDVVDNTTGTTRKNTAGLSWDDRDKTDPTTAGATFDENGSTGSATVTVNQPSLSIGKVVSNATPQPGSSFTYTLTVSNSSAANTSTAYNVTVVDTVPTGVVVGTINNAGTITGAGANGGGTITWVLPSTIAAASSTTLTYTASLAASGTLTTSALSNSAKVMSYSSLLSGGRSYGPSAAAVAKVTPKFPSITLTKAAPNGSVAYAATSFDWRLTMTNGASAGVATTVTPTDQLPLNWTYDAHSAFVSIAGATATQIEPTVTTSAGVQTLVWSSFGPLAAGKTVVIDYKATPTIAAMTSPGVGSTHLHENTFTAVTTDPTGATASASGSYTGARGVADATINSADLSITKAAVGTLVAGQTTSNAWTITVKNNSGGDPAVGPFTVVDTPSTLPTGVTVTSASGTGWICGTPDTTTGAFTCTIGGSYASGATLPVITVAARVAADVAAGTVVTNGATATSATYDPTTPNSSTSDSTVATKADLALAKTVSGSVKAGQTVTWLLSLSNLGPSVSRGPITVTDTLPSAIGTVTATGAGWSCSQASTTLTCTMAGDLAVGSAPQIQVSGTLPASFTGNLDNSAVVTATTADPVTTNNASSVSTAADTATTLGLTKSLTSVPLVPGSTAIYRFDVTNTGLADARTVAIVDALPDGLVYAGSSTSITGSWSCSETSTSPSTVTCSLSGPLSAASGSNTAAVSILVTLPSSLAATVTNSGTVSAANATSVTASTSGAAPVGSADLTLSKSHPSGAVYAGTSVSYTLTAHNAGPSDSIGPITISDTMPGGMTPTSASGTGWTCSVALQVASCSLAAGLANGRSSSITIVGNIATGAGPTTLTNTATVSGPVDDPDLGNNVAHDPTIVTNSADVSITKSGSATVVAGQQTTYTVVVSNAGPSDATSLAVTDILPSGMTAVSIAGAGWTCTLASFACTMPSLAPGSSTITVKALVASDVANGSSLTNTARVQWVDGAGTSTRSADATATVDAIADLVLVKTAAHPTVSAGGQAGFSFDLSNAGPSDAVGPITITDTLPTGMSFVSSAGSWTCAPEVANTQIVDCTLNGAAGLAAAATASALSITVQVDASLPSGTLTNTAHAASTTTDSNSADNDSSAHVGVGLDADLSIVKTFTGPVRIGDPMGFTLTVHNNGPSDATAVEVTDDVPSSFSTVDLGSVAPAWSCTAGTPTIMATPVDCTLSSTLPSGSTAPAIVFTAVPTVAAYPQVVNSAEVTSSTPDSVSSNNTSSVTVPVPPQVSLTVTKKHVGEVVLGQNATYLVTVTNAGPTEQPGGYWIVDHLPSQLSYVSSSGTDVTCAMRSGELACTFADALAVGDTAAVTLTLAVSSTAGSEIINMAEVGTTDEQLATLALTDTDTAQTMKPALAFTGATVGFALAGLLVGGLLLAGLILVGFGRRRRRRS